VAEAENGAEALQRCAAAMPDLILLDWNMPVMSGIEFVTALRGKPGGAKPKVVFCTTENDPSFIGKGIAAGADGYVTKPFDQASLRGRLERIGAA
jgi:two-component system chemotaxis response regulator CheY